METVTIPEDVRSPISSLVHRGLFENKRSAIVNIVHDLSLSKMKEYEMAMQRFETYADKFKYSESRPSSEELKWQSMW